MLPDAKPARLVADSSFARAKLGWIPRYASLETIIEHAWQWEQRTFDDEKHT